jgi:hypothetical protein
MTRSLVGSNCHGVPEAHFAAGCPRSSSSAARLATEHRAAPQRPRSLQVQHGRAAMAKASNNIPVGFLRELHLGGFAGTV